MREIKEKIILLLYRIFPQRRIQYEKEEFSDLNNEHKFLKGIKGSDKIRVAKHLERQL